MVDDSAPATLILAAALAVTDQPELLGVCIEGLGLLGGHHGGEQGRVLDREMNKWCNVPHILFLYLAITLAPLHQLRRQR